MLMKIITASSELSGRTRKQKDAPDVWESPAIRRLLRIWVMHCTCTQVDVSLCLLWPCGTIRAAPTQIKNTQLGALLKAILCSQKIGIKLPGSQPLSEKQRQVCLGIFPAAHTHVGQGEGRDQFHWAHVAQSGFPVHRSLTLTPNPNTLIFPIIPGSITVNT